MTRGLFLVLALVACTSRDDGDIPTTVGPPPRLAKPAAAKVPGTTPGAPDPTSADALIHDAKQRAQAYDLSRITIEYIASDGMLDPRYSKGTVVFTQDRPEPPDDPERPTGAPSTPTPRISTARKCPTWSWEPGSWASSQGHCGAARIDAVRCPVLVIWQRAIADGAPPDALATLSMTGRSARSTTPPRWSFEIRDTVRGVSFSRAYPDDCGPIAEAPDPSVPSDRPLPASLDRTMIANAIGTAKPKIRGCQITRSRATVKISVKVTPDGVATTTVKEATSAELGECVAAVIDALPFPRTRSGGMFSYPLTF